jgi:hypothetical protein
VDFRTDLLSLRGAYKIKLPHLIGGGADQAAAAERQKRKTKLISQSPGESTIELLLISQHQDWMLEEKIQN